MVSPTAMAKPGENFKAKTKDNDWCPSCGGGGGEMVRTPKDDYAQPLVYEECKRCGGSGVIPKSKRSA